MLTNLLPAKQSLLKPTRLDLDDNTLVDPIHHVKTEPLDYDSDNTESHRSWSPVIKSRRRFSSSETKYLQSEFEKSSNPPGKALSEIAKTIGTTRRIITTWFQNHRAKEKRSIHYDPKKKKIVKKQDPQRARRKTKVGMNSEFEILSSTPASDPLTPFDEKEQDKKYDYYQCIPFNPYEYNASFGEFDDRIMPFEWEYPQYLSPSSPSSSFSSSFSSSSSLSSPFPYPIISWSQSLVCCPPFPYPYWSTTPGPLPQCCLDEMFTGIPCTFHSF